MQRFKQYVGHDTQQTPLARAKWFGDSPELYRKYLKDHCTDESGNISDPIGREWTYELNSLGYRGDEENPNAKASLLFFGCSHTFGSGLPISKSYPYFFLELFCETNELNPCEVELLNFSSVGASNDLISRTCLTQTMHFRPTLVITYFTAKTRTEYVQGDHVVSLQPRMTSEIAHKYYDYYTDEVGFLSTARSIIITQNTLRARKIPYIFVIQNISDFENPKFRHNSICAELIQQIDFSRVAPTTLEMLEVDRATDGIHSGPKTNSRMARALHHFYSNQKDLLHGFL